MTDTQKEEVERLYFDGAVLTTEQWELWEAMVPPFFELYTKGKAWGKTFLLVGFIKFLNALEQEYYAQPGTWQPPFGQQPQPEPGDHA